MRTIAGDSATGMPRRRTNLTDEEYFITKFDLTGAGAGTISGMPGRPREWAISVKKHF